MCVASATPEDANFDWSATVSVAALASEDACAPVTTAELQKARLNSFCRYAAEYITWAAQTLEANLFSKE
jgi:hypothetical protein